MRVHIICQNIDLGYHIHSVYLSENLANEKCKELNQEYTLKKIQKLIDNCGDSREVAEKYVKERGPEYFVESYEVEP